MTELQTDEEKVEAIKQWWKANGISVIAGITIGLGAVIGWRTWVNYQDSVAQQASIAFEQLLSSTANTANGMSESAEKQAEILVGNYANTPYAMFADLAAAKVRIENGDTIGASAALESAIERAPDPGLAKIAALRLARVLIASGELTKAKNIIDTYGNSDAFAADFTALRGDIASAQGQFGAARAAYQKAIDSGAANARLIELKLRELPAEDAS